jgi:hypothetical protein
MNVKSAATVLMVLIETGSLAHAAETHPIPARDLVLPEPIERAVAVDARTPQQIHAALGWPPDTAWKLEASGRSFGAITPEDILPIGPARKSPFVAKLNNYPEVPKELKEAARLLMEGKLEEAKASLRDTRRWEHNLPSAGVTLYLVFDAANLPIAARSSLDKAVIEESADPEPWVFLGEIAIDENRIAEAENDFNQAKKLLADYNNLKRKPRLEKRVSRGIAEIMKIRKGWNTRLP